MQLRVKWVIRLLHRNSKELKGHRVIKHELQVRFSIHWRDVGFEQCCEKFERFERYEYEEEA